MPLMTTWRLTISDRVRGKGHTPPSGTSNRVPHSPMLCPEQDWNWVNSGQTGDGGRCHPGGGPGQGVRPGARASTSSVPNRDSYSRTTLARRFASRLAAKGLRIIRSVSWTWTSFRPRSQAWLMPNTRTTSSRVLDTLQTLAYELFRLLSSHRIVGVAPAAAARVACAVSSRSAVMDFSPPFLAGIFHYCRVQGLLSRLSARLLMYGRTACTSTLFPVSCVVSRPGPAPRSPTRALRASETPG